MLVFISGWRGKYGIAALLLPISLMAGWMRSYITEDEFICRGQAVAYFFRSFNGSLEFESNTNPAVIENTYGAFPTGWRTLPGELIVPTPPEYPRQDNLEGFKVLFRWRFCGFDIGTAVDPLIPMRIFSCTLPYVLLVAPLTAVSAYLLTSPTSKPPSTIVSALKSHSKTNCDAK